MFLILLVLISFDAIPTNITGLIMPGLILRRSFSSPFVSITKRGLTSKPLYPAVEFIDELKETEETAFGEELIKIEKSYSNFHEKTSMDSIKQELKGKAGIYAFKHNDSGKVYIGSSNNLGSRFWDHVKDRSSNIHLQRAFIKYGLENFTFIIIETLDNKTLDNKDLSKEELYTKLIKFKKKSEVLAFLE
jgi:predicted GIY-YIG superfamily endonuclease